MPSQLPSLSIASILHTQSLIRRPELPDLKSEPQVHSLQTNFPALAQVQQPVRFSQWTVQDSRNKRRVSQLLRRIQTEPVHWRLCYGAVGTELCSAS